MDSEKTLITSRDPEGLHTVSIFESAYNDAKLDSKKAQFLKKKGGKFKDGIINLINRLTFEDNFTTEEVSSTHRYPAKYDGPKPIERQIYELSSYFDLDTSHALRYVKNLPDLPTNAEGWFAVPNIDVVGQRFFPDVLSYIDRYCMLVKLVHEKLKNQRKFYSCQKRQTNSEHLNISHRTMCYMNVLMDKQPGDILVIPAQLGLLHAGKSALGAENSFARNEFGLGAFVMGCILLTHRKRLSHLHELDIICPGDTFSFEACSKFSSVPIYFYLGRVEFDECWKGSNLSHYGSATGFVPSSKF